MKKYVKHYISYRLEDGFVSYCAGDIESADVCDIVKKYGTEEINYKKALAGFTDSFDMIAFGLHDVCFIEDDLLYRSGIINMKWIYFGKRVSILEYDKSSQRIVGDKDADSFCKIGNMFYALGENDLVFDEFIDEYYKELESVNLRVLR